eukprot:symbB.v1.2.002649.t1/scaffold142.1/size299426/7
MELAVQWPFGPRRQCMSSGRKCKSWKTKRLLTLAKIAPLVSLLQESDRGDGSQGSGVLDRIKMRLEGQGTYAVISALACRPATTAPSSDQKML